MSKIEMLLDKIESGEVNPIEAYLAYKSKEKEVKEFLKAIEEYAYKDINELPEGKGLVPW
jgi:hypothetical protein